MPFFICNGRRWGSSGTNHLAMQIEDLKREYCSPEVEVIEVEVETGFAGSPVIGGDNTQNGGGA